MFVKICFLCVVLPAGIDQGTLSLIVVGALFLVFEHLLPPTSPWDFEAGGSHMRRTQRHGARCRAISHLPVYRSWIRIFEVLMMNSKKVPAGSNGGRRLGQAEADED